jgi:hypothetical protein
MIETMFIDDLQVHGGTVYGVSQFSIGSPAPRAVTESRPSAHGASDDTRFYGPRTMEVVGRVLATDTASLWPLVDALKGALRLGSWHVLKFRRAGLTYDERALVRVDSPVDIPLVLGSVRMVTFGVSLFAPDPRIYSDTLSSGVYDPTTTGGSSLTFPVTFPVSFGGDDSSATLDVVNEGNIDTPAVFTITGPVVNPVIVNETTGERITTTGLDLSEGEEVIIDAAARSVNLAVGIGAARPDLIDSSRTDWFELAPGTNQLRMTGTGMSSGATSLAVEYRSARI